MLAVGFLSSMGAMARAPHSPWVQAVERAWAAAGRIVVETGHVLSWLAAKTGFPSLVLAAAAPGLSIRLAKKLGRVALEFALALVVLLALQKLGVMHW